MTKVTDLLDSYNIPYRLKYHTEPALTVEALVEQGWASEEMVKAILLREQSQPRRYVLACVLGHTQLDPKAVRACLAGDWKRLTFAAAEEIFTTTGYLQGAVTPLGLPAGMPVIFDQAIVNCPKVNISSGDPSLGLELKTQDLIHLCRAQLAPIAREIRK
jgi:Cys-tRNA(Pro)/Cys-tRNA(Cys) deacylase